MAQIIDGKAIASAIRDEIKEDVKAFVLRTGRTPKLVVVMVGQNPASQVYVRNKQKACEKAGIDTETIILSESTPENEVIELIDKLNHDIDVSGILVQLPLPSHINENRIISEISYKKDVDGLNPVNSGLLVNRLAKLVPCTPMGCVELLKREGVSLSGKNVVIIGRSRLVGLPLFNLLTQENCTVTVCHSKTENLSEYTKRADIVIAAAGKPRLLTGDMVKPGVVVIDVGINRLEDGTLTGDVDFESVADIASKITPVPGGVGPMTICMLLRNTLTAAEELYG